jgi:phage terminase large subunit-like protein
LPENFYSPNPNLGASVDENFLVDQAAKAERAGKSSVLLFEAKHLNMEAGMALRSDGWAGAEIWDRGLEPGLTLDVLLDRSEIVTVGIDGGGLDDLLGIGVIGRERGTKRWLAWAHALISPEGLERRKGNAEAYADFQADGDLTLIDQLPDDITFVVDVVKRIRDRGLLAQVGVDAAGIGAIVDALAEINITQDAEKLGAVRQGIALMGAIKTIERKLADRSFCHSGSRLMAWCVSNARVVPTPTAMRIARDEAGYGKVDPLMALFNSASLMSMNPAQDIGRALHAAILERGGFA